LDVASPLRISLHRKRCVAHHFDNESL